MSDHEQYQIYHNVDVLYKNMKIMNKGIGDIRTDIYKLEHDRRLSEHGNSFAKFAGCDGLDQDQDGISDNCEEDFTPPELVIPSGMGLVRSGKTEANQIVSNQVFKSDEDATSHLKTILGVSDDCAPASSLELDLTIVDDSSKDSCTSTVRAKPVHMCDGFATAGTERSFDVHVDTTPPVVTCGFNAATAADGKILLFDEKLDGSIQLADTGFFYNITVRT